MEGGMYVGGLEAEAVSFCLRARTQQNMTRPVINTSIMAAPAGLRRLRLEVARQGRVVGCTFELGPEPKLFCKA